MGDATDKKEVMIPLTSCHWRSIYKKKVIIPLTGGHWRSNYQQGGWDTINRLLLEIQSKQKEGQDSINGLSLEIQLTKRRLGSH